jgi:rubrerythrin
MQGNFADAMQDLLELEYDAIEAYEAAIERLETKEYRDKLSEFLSDHKRHVGDLSRLLGKHDEDIPTSPSGKQWITKGRVVLANLVGDSYVLTAMAANEVDTNTAYERMNKHKDCWDDAVDVLKRGLEDEKRHKQWLDQF